MTVQNRNVLPDVAITIRHAVTADASKIAALHIRTWQVAYRGQLPDYYLDQLDHDLQRRTQSWREQITSVGRAHIEIWVAESNGQVLGFAAIGPERETTSQDTGELYAIYVDPERWRGSIGHRLLHHAMTRLADCGYSSATLWVLDTNLRARRFYERHGWLDDTTAKIDQRPNGLELREVRYRVLLQRPKSR